MADENIRVTIELTPKEYKHLTNFCILRAIKSAAKAVPDDYDYLEELLEAGELYERLRNKLVEEIFRVKAV
jgi:hypothetical protein